MKLGLLKICLLNALYHEVVAHQDHESLIALQLEALAGLKYGALVRLRSGHFGVTLNKPSCAMLQPSNSWFYTSMVHDRDSDGLVQSSIDHQVRL